MDSGADEVVDSGDVGCVEVGGAGCGRLGEPERSTCDSEEGQDPGGAEVPEGQVEGGALSCAGVGPGLWLMALLLLLRRRRRWLALALLGPLWSGALGEAHAQGVDANQIEVLDGGDFPSLMEARLGGPWSAAAAVSVQYARDLVVLNSPGAVEVLLGGAMVRTVGASLRLGELVRVGVAMPRYRFVDWRGVVLDAPGRGDLSLWVSVPIIERPEEGLALAWTVKTDFNTGLPQYFLGDPTGSVTGLLSAELRTGARVELAANAGARLMPTAYLPGVEWGRRFEYGLGTRVAVLGPLFSTAELRGSAPLGFAPTAASSYHPLEVLAHVGLLLPKDLALQAGGGTGLSKGLGSPAWRASVVLDYAKRAHPDRDGDGLVDPRDVCPDEPEDLDDFRDIDGCPDPDNDEDGLPDRVDACPNQPEVYNDHRDEDGCPDRIAELRLVLRSEEPGRLESAEVKVGADPEEAPLAVIPGEVVLLRLSPGEYPVSARGEGHHPLEQRYELPRDGGDLELVLAPIRFGEVALTVVNPAGEAIPAFLREAGGLRPLPAEGVVLERQEGPATLSLRAAGYLPVELTLEVLPGERLERVVTLQPSGIQVTRQRVELGRPLPFALDSAELLPEGERLVDELAALLRATPEIALLRVEGHADAQGSSRYNLELSQRRAEAVVQALVEAGVEPERLQALGTGEARPQAGAEASRRVELLVLIWDDEAGAAPELSY